MQVPRGSADIAQVTPDGPDQEAGEVCRGGGGPVTPGNVGKVRGFLSQSNGPGREEVERSCYTLMGQPEKWHPGSGKGTSGLGLWTQESGSALTQARGRLTMV